MVVATSTATVWGLSMLSISMVIVLFYIVMAFSTLYIIGFGLIKFIKPIYRLLNHD